MWNKIRNHSHRVIVRVIAGVLSVDVLEDVKGVIVVAALHHELGALREGEQPEAEQQRGDAARRDEPIPRVVGERAVFHSDASDGDNAPRDHCKISGYT